MFEIVTTAPAETVMSGTLWHRGPRSNLNLRVRSFSVTNLCAWRRMSNDDCRILVFTLWPGYAFSPSICWFKFGKKIFTGLTLHFIGRRKIRLTRGAFKMILVFGMHRED